MNYLPMSKYARERFFQRTWYVAGLYLLLMATAMYANRMYLGGVETPAVVILFAVFGVIPYAMRTINNTELYDGEQLLQ